MHNGQDEARDILRFCDRFRVSSQMPVFMVFYPYEQKMTNTVLVRKLRISWIQVYFINRVIHRLFRLSNALPATADCVALAVFRRRRQGEPDSLFD